MPQLRVCFYALLARNQGIQIVEFCLFSQGQGVGLAYSVCDSVDNFGG